MDSYRPIYLTPEEAAKPFDEAVEKVRNELTRLRGKLYDIARLNPGWKERVDFAEGGLTCVISALYPGIIEYRQVHAPKKTK